MKKSTTLFFSTLILLSFSLYSQNKSKSISYNSENQSQITNNKDDVTFFLWQDFDSGAMPPAGWNLISGTTPETWRLGNTDVFPPISGDYFMLCRYDDTYVPEGQDERLLTPVFDLTGLSDGKMAFWFLFSRYWGITPNDNYDLQLLVSIDAGTTFSQPIWTELSTDTAAWSSWQWIRAEVDISPYVGQNGVQFCFRYVGLDGADAAIEDLEITFVTSVGETVTEKIRLYPNPAENFLILEMPGTKDVNVFDLTGKIVLQTQLQPEQQHLNVSFLPAGTYNISVTQKENQTNTGFVFIKQ